MYSKVLANTPPDYVPYLSTYVPIALPDYELYLSMCST